MTNENIDLIRSKYFDWLALSVDERRNMGEPLTYTDFAVHHGVTRRTLNNWEREKEEERVIESGTDLEKVEFLKKIKPFALSGKNSRYADLYTTLKGWKITKTEETHKVEFTVNDRQVLYTDFIKELDREAKESGICPVCHQHQTLRVESCLDTKSEHDTD